MKEKNKLTPKGHILAITNTIWNFFFNPLATLMAYIKAQKKIFSGSANSFKAVQKVFTNTIDMQLLLFFTLVGSIIGATVGAVCFVFLLLPLLSTNLIATIFIGYGITLAGSILLKWVGLLAGRFFNDPLPEQSKASTTPVLLAVLGNSAKYVQNLSNLKHVESVLKLLLNLVGNLFFNPLATLLTYIKAPKNPINRSLARGAVIGAILGAALFFILFVSTPILPALINLGVGKVALAFIGYGIVNLFSVLGKTVELAIWNQSKDGKSLTKRILEAGLAPPSTLATAFLGDVYNPLLSQKYADPEMNWVFIDQKPLVDSIPEQIAAVEEKDRKLLEQIKLGNLSRTSSFATTTEQLAASNGREGLKADKLNGQALDQVGHQEALASLQSQSGTAAPFSTGVADGFNPYSPSTISSLTNSVTAARQVGLLRDTSTTSAPNVATVQHQTGNGADLPNPQ